MTIEAGHYSDQPLVMIFFGIILVDCQIGLLENYLVTGDWSLSKNRTDAAERSPSSINDSLTDSK